MKNLLKQLWSQYVTLYGDSRHTWVVPGIPTV